MHACEPPDEKGSVNPVPIEQELHCLALYKKESFTATKNNWQSLIEREDPDFCHRVGGRTQNFISIKRSLSQVSSAVSSPSSSSPAWS